MKGACGLAVPPNLMDAKSSATCRFAKEHVADDKQAASSTGAASSSGGPSQDTPTCLRAGAWRIAVCGPLRAGRCLVRGQACSATWHKPRAQVDRLPQQPRQLCPHMNLARPVPPRAFISMGMSGCHSRRRSLLSSGAARRHRGSPGQSLSSQCLVLHGSCMALHAHLAQTMPLSHWSRSSGTAGSSRLPWLPSHLALGTSALPHL